MKKVFLVLALFLFIPNIVFGAIAYDTSTNDDTTDATLTFAHINGVSDNDFLVVAIWDDGGDLVTGVTYAGVSMTQTAKVQEGSYNKYVYLYTLVDPASGSNNVVVTKSADTGVVEAIASTYSGVDQTTPIDVYDTKTGSYVDFSIEVTTVTDNAWLGSVAYIDNQSTKPTVNNLTDRASGTTYWTNYGDSNDAKSPVGDYTAGWQSTNSTQPGGSIVFGIRPYTGSATSTVDSLIACESSTSTDCVWYHNLYDGSDDPLANFNPFYLFFILIVEYFPFIIVGAVLFTILKFLTFFWAWRKL